MYFRDSSGDKPPPSVAAKAENEGESADLTLKESVALPGPLPRVDASKFPAAVAKDIALVTIRADLLPSSPEHISS